MHATKVICHLGGVHQFESCSAGEPPTAMMMNQGWLWGLLSTRGQLESRAMQMHQLLVGAIQSSPQTHSWVMQSSAMVPKYSLIPQVKLKSTYHSLLSPPPTQPTAKLGPVQATLSGNVAAAHLKTPDPLLALGGSLE